MLKRILFTLVFLTFVGTSMAQESEEGSSTSENAKNVAYAELLGKGFYYSFNFERELYRIDENIAFNASVGFGLYNGQTDIEKSKDLFIPLELNAKYSFGGSHHAVLGYGTTYWKYKVIDIKIDNSNVGDAPATPTLKPMKEWFAHLTLEYRYQKPEGKFMLKAGMTPLFFDFMSYSAFDKNSNYQMSFHLGAGWAF